MLEARQTTLEVVEQRALRPAHPSPKLNVKMGVGRANVFSHLTSTQYSLDEMIIPTDTF